MSYRMRMTILAALTAVLIGGCASPQSSGTAQKEDVRIAVFKPCSYPVSRDVDPTSRSYAALTHSIHELQWEILTLRPDMGLIFSRVPYRGIEFTVRFAILADGSVEVSPQSPNGLGGRTAAVLGKLIDRLRISFSASRCMAGEAVMRQLEFVGIS